MTVFSDTTTTLTRMVPVMVAAKVLRGATQYKKPKKRAKPKRKVTARRRKVKRRKR